MSALFDKVLAEHLSESEKAQAVAREKAAQELSASASFGKRFGEAVAQIAEPLFSEFAAKARQEGFDAAVSEGVDHLKNPYILIAFTTRGGQKLNAGRNQAEYKLTGWLRTQKVEHKRKCTPGPWTNAKTDEGGLPSLNANALESHLGELLKEGLKEYR